jgi:hypothetical protein
VAEGVAQLVGALPVGPHPIRRTVDRDHDPTVQHPGEQGRRYLYLWSWTV